MGLGAYLAAVTDRDHYLSEEKREREEVMIKPEDEKEEIYEIMDNYGISREASKPLVDSLCQDPENWIKVSVFAIQLFRASAHV
jgi:vacuolar iron transporter family protein